MSIQTVAIVGAGTMGRQIALNAAMHGFETYVQDAYPGVVEQVGQWSRAYLDGRVAKGRMSAEEAAATRAHFHLEADLVAAVSSADVVIEAIVEDLNVKLALFAQLDAMTKPSCILASNSSTFFPSQYRVATQRSDKVIGMHYFNPVLQMKLLEIVMSDTVSEETLALVQAHGAATGKKTIVAVKERPGFIVNNIFGAITNMAWDLLEGGFATAQDIDTAAEKGLGHPMGPFRTMDASGIDTIFNVRKARHEADPETFPAPNAILTGMVERGELGMKTGRGFYDYSESGKR